MVKRNAEAELNLPPGFRFFPTDEELVVHYLYKKVNQLALPVPIIAEVDLYKYDPWQLPEKALFGEKEWYFFTPRERKYPNGSRPNRAAGTGYWKATGADKPIASKAGKKRVGIKKALVFYAGKAPRGNKTNWIMHEYRVADPAKPARKKGSLRLDDWVLCRIYNKKSSAEKAAMEQQNPSVSMDHSGVEQSHLSSEQDHFRGAGCQKENASVCVPAIDFQHPEVFHGVGGFAVNGPLRNCAQQQQILDFGGFQNQWPNYGSSAQILSGLQTDSSSSKPESPEFFSEKEEVESSLTADQKQQQQQGFFGSSVEGLQNSFPAFDNGISIPDCYQDYMPSLTSSDYLPKFYASDLLFQ